MALRALGYIGLASNRLDEWAYCGSDLLGLELVERTSRTLKFRMDDRKQRIIVSDTEEDAGNVYGWEVDDASALNDLANRLETVNIPVRNLGKSDVALRRVTEGFAFLDQAGTVMRQSTAQKQSTRH